jgi:hypothetical protein
VPYLRPAESTKVSVFDLRNRDAGKDIKAVGDTNPDKIRGCGYCTDSFHETENLALRCALQLLAQECTGNADCQLRLGHALCVTLFFNLGQVMQPARQHIKRVDHRDYGAIRKVERNGSPAVDGDLNPRLCGERRGLVAEVPVVVLWSSSVC